MGEDIDINLKNRLILNIEKMGETEIKELRWQKQVKHTHYNKCK
jgi:hypothetical protein